MQAGVKVGSSVTDRFEVWNGLMQGCMMAPTVFNIYFNVMVDRLHIQSTKAGVPILYKHSRKRWVIE